jgi:hypothetical protein
MTLPAFQFKKEIYHYFNNQSITNTITPERRSRMIKSIGIGIFIGFSYWIVMPLE